MTAEDWARLGLLGNEIGMQWYAITHPQAVLPNQNMVITPLPGGGSASVNTNLLIVGAVIVAVVLFMK